MAGRSGIYSSLAIAAVLFGAVAVLVVFQSRVPERHDETPVPIKESNGQPPDVVPDSTPSTNLTPPKSESHTSDQTVEPSRRQLNGVVRGVRGESARAASPRPLRPHALVIVSIVGAASWVV